MSTFDSSSSAVSDSGASPSHAHPSVSKAQWASFALGKLNDGYCLVQHPNGNAYQFYKPGVPLQPCAPHAARKLLALGLLDVAKADIRGTQYALRAAFQPDGPAA